jgi:hypothetical protein
LITTSADWAQDNITKNHARNTPDIHIYDNYQTKQHLLSSLEMSIDPKNILEIHSFALLTYPVGKGHNDQIARRPIEPRGRK